MPDFGERSSCSEKIFIPPSFPSIMKGYCKAAIRTQPYDLLRWSAAYFRALANGENPPVKERLEFPPTFGKPGLTPGYLKVLVNQLGRTPDIIVTTEALVHKWTALCLPPDNLYPLLNIVNDAEFPWLRFVAVAAGSISASLTQTMILLCELLTDDPEGGKAAIPVETFLDLYQYLAYLNCGSYPTAAQSVDGEGLDSTKTEVGDSLSTMTNVPVTEEDAIGTINEPQNAECYFPGIGPKIPEAQVQKVIEFMEHWAGRQGGMVMPRNIRHWMCPPLDNSFLLNL